MKTFTDGNFLDPVPISERTFTAPFPEISDQYVHSQRFIQRSSRFRTTRLGTADPDFPQSYLISESERFPHGKGIVSWTRTYSRIPSRRRIGESYAWTLPGLSTTAFYTPRIINNSGSRNIGGSATQIQTIESHGLVVGDSVLISATITTGDVQQTFHFQRKVASVVNLNAITVTPAVIEGGSVFYLTLSKLEGGRDPRTETVHSWLIYDYYLPGLPGQPTSSNEIEIIKVPIILDSVGKETDSYSITTTPTKAAYLSDVASNRQIVSESSVIRPWEGPILERVTRYVRAQ
jgi:hypothetical protein